MTPGPNKTHELIRHWMAEGLGWEDIDVLLIRRGLRCKREDVRQYVLKLNKFYKRAA